MHLFVYCEEQKTRANAAKAISVVDCSKEKLTMSGYYNDFPRMHTFNS